MKMYGEDGAHPYAGWTELKASWAWACKFLQAKHELGVAKSFTHIQSRLLWWWRDSSSLKHGWNTKTRAKYAKGFKP